MLAARTPFVQTQLWPHSASSSYKPELQHNFIDFTKAFDRVWHQGIWAVLRKYNISKCLLLISRYQVNDLIWRALSRAKILYSKEPSRPSRTDRKRPDSMNLIPWQEGRNLLWDITVVDTLAASHMPSTSRLRRVREKKRMLNKACQDVHSYPNRSRNSLSFFADLDRRI